MEKETTRIFMYKNMPMFCFLLDDGAAVILSAAGLNTCALFTSSFSPLLFSFVPVL
jgi:hypothetical protein